MQGSLSLWMDAWRLLAVMMVFFTHVKNDPAGRFLHPLGLYGPEGVAIFFVLSGALVATSAWKPGVTYRSYAVARLARLWSVVIPAVLLTIALDVVGRSISPSVYATVPAWTLNATGAWRALAPVLFVNQIPGIGLEPGSNGPFWSLCPEAWCYIAFAVASFGRGILRIAGLIAIAAFVGPGILSLALIWGLGVLLAVILRRPPTPRLPWKTLFWTTLLLVPLWLRGKYQIMAAVGLPSIMVEGYIPALLMALNVLSFRNAAMRFPAKAGAILHLLIPRTFSLYLIQAPVLYFLAVLFDAAGLDGPIRVALLVLLTPVAAAVFAGQTELKRAVWAAWLNRRLGPIPDRLVPECGFGGREPPG
jgi:peptidoglycan/LPS O-acetylase OafA/YrhL